MNPRKQARRAARDAVGQVDKTVRVLLPLFESRGEHKVACKAGCNACCTQFVRASLAEGLVIADWLNEPGNKAVLARYREKLPAWRATAGAEGEELASLMAASAGGAQEGPAWQRFLVLQTRYRRKQNMCPFNHLGNCEIYPVRPAICRAYNVADTADNCGADPKSPPAVIRHPHLDQAMARVAGLAGFFGPPRPIPESVEWALANR